MVTARRIDTPKFIRALISPQAGRRAMNHSNGDFKLSAIQIPAAQNAKTAMIKVLG
jgi:hypothetical protein